MALSRRALMGTLGAGVLGTGVLSACGEGMPRGRRGRRRPTTTAPTADPLAEPDQGLVLGSIGASYGTAGRFEKQIGIAVNEAMIDINAKFGGLFGHDVTMVPRHVMADAGEDLSTAIAGLVDQGVTAVVSSLDEDALVTALPLFVEAGIAVIDVFTSSMTVRGEDVEHAGMLARLVPNDQITAARLVEDSFSTGGGDREGTPGHLAYISENTSQGRSLLDQINPIRNVRGGQLVVERFHPVGDMEDIDDLVATVVEKRPALLVVNSGPEAGPFLSALHEATLDEGNRPTLEIQVRLSPAASVDYSQAGLAAESLRNARGWEPGGELTEEHVRMMINVDQTLLTTGFAYSQQAYDAVMLACLAAQDALSTAGPDIAASLAAVLVGDTECTDYGMCRTALRDALEAGSRATITYTGRMGPLELGGVGDAAKGELRTCSWSDAGELVPGNAEGFEATA